MSFQGHKYFLGVKVGSAILAGSQIGWYDCPPVPGRDYVCTSDQSRLLLQLNVPQVDSSDLTQLRLKDC